MSAHDEIAELAAVHALGALDGPDRERLEAVLRSADGEEVRQLLREFEETLVALAREERAPAAPAHVRASLLARIAAADRVGPTVDVPRIPRAPERVRRSRWATVLAGAVAAGLAAALAGLLVSQAYQQRLDALGREVQALREDVRAQQGLLALLRDPGTQVVSLAGQAPSPAARARMMWNAAAGGLLVAEGLPPAPAGKAYQLWAIAGGAPVSAGVFEVGPDGAAALKVPALPGVGRVEVFAVTLEPAGGLPAPSGAMFLVGKAG